MFRSDAVQPGDRVVVRRQRGDHKSDVIGHVVSLNPLVVRPQAVGGLPSEAEAIEIAQPQVIRRLSPRTVRNSDIRAIETASAKAFPGREQQLIGGWLARAGAEPAPRSSSATPIGHSAGFNPVPMDELADFYRRRGMPVRLLIPERIGKPALRVVPKETLSGEILVMTAEVTGAWDERVLIDAAPHPDWLPLCRYRGQDMTREQAEDLTRPIDGRLGFARLVQDGQTAAVARAAITASEDGRQWLGISAVEVGERWRRQAMGSRLVESLLAWGAAEGADAAYLQVQASNAVAVAMYEKLGFIEHHRHRYAQLG